MSHQEIRPIARPVPAPQPDPQKETPPGKGGASTAITARQNPIIHQSEEIALIHAKVADDIKTMFLTVALKRHGRRLDLCRQAMHTPQLRTVAP